MSIPLVQNNEKDSINTSIIAIKRQIERINALLGLSSSEEIDTSVFATKDELQQAVTDLQPVDEVTADNMHSVTSNAVYTELVDGGNWVNISTGSSLMMYKKVGKTVFLHIDTSNGTLKFPVSGVAQLNGETLYLPSAIRPSRNTNVPFIDNTNDYVVHARIRSDGMIQAWNTSTFDVTSVNSWQAEWVYRVD